MKNFEWHVAYWSAIKDPHVALAYMPNLTTIDLSNNLSITSLQFVLSCPDIEEIIVPGCSNIPLINLEIVSPQLPNLKTVDISENLITGRCLHRLLHELQSLQHLNIQDCISLMLDSVIYIGEKLETLSFCPLLHTNEIADWIRLMGDNPRYCVCPTSLEVLLNHRNGTEKGKSSNFPGKGYVCHN